MFEEYINTWFGPKCNCSIGRIIDLLLVYLFMYLLYTFYTMSNFIVYFHSDFVRFIRFSLFIFVFFDLLYSNNK